MEIKITHVCVCAHTHARIGRYMYVYILANWLQVERVAAINILLLQSTCLSANISLTLLELRSQHHNFKNIEFIKCIHVVYESQKTCSFSDLCQRLLGRLIEHHLENVPEFRGMCVSINHYWLAYIYAYLEIKIRY